MISDPFGYLCGTSIATDETFVSMAVPATVFVYLESPD